MPTFVSEQAHKDYLALKDTLRRAEFTNDRPMIDWCERYLSLCRPTEQIRTMLLLPEHRKMKHEDLVPKQPRLIKEP
jgi:hypothetical protein